MDIKYQLMRYGGIFVGCLVVIAALTTLAANTVTLPRPLIQKAFAQWVQDWEGKRMNDWADGRILSNYLYRVLDPNLTFWLYYRPSCAPRHPWDRLKHSIDPANHAALADDIRNRQGRLQYRYWTGHLVATTLLLAAMPDLEAASQTTANIVMLSLLAYLLAWGRRFGVGSALVVGAILIGTGAVQYESFHNITWGLAVAFLAGAFLSRAISHKSSVVPVAVVSAVFANWVGYDHVFDTIAFSLPFFIVNENGQLSQQGLRPPLFFIGVILLVTAMMMALRFPLVALLGYEPLQFLAKLSSQTVYRMGGDFSLEDPLRGESASRVLAVKRTLPVFEYYLFRFSGFLAPPIKSVWAYLLFQALPLMISALLLLRMCVTSAIELLTPIATLALSVLLFHTMFLVFYNHACVHPYLEVRHMVFCSALLWGITYSLLTATCWRVSN